MLQRLQVYRHHLLHVLSSRYRRERLSKRRHRRGRGLPALQHYSSGQESPTPPGHLVQEWGWGPGLQVSQPITIALMIKLFIIVFWGRLEANFFLQKIDKKAVKKRGTTSCGIYVVAISATCIYII